MSWSNNVAAVLVNIVAIFAVAVVAASLAMLVQIIRQGGWKLAEPAIRKARWRMVRPWMLVGAVIGLLFGVAIVFLNRMEETPPPNQRMSSPPRPPKSNPDRVWASRPRRSTTDGKLELPPGCPRLIGVAPIAAGYRGRLRRKEDCGETSARSEHVPYGSRHSVASLGCAAPVATQRPSRNSITRTRGEIDRFRWHWISHSNWVRIVAPNLRRNPLNPRRNCWTASDGANLGHPTSSEPAFRSGRSTALDALALAEYDSSVGHFLPPSGPEMRTETRPSPEPASSPSVPTGCD